ncbi:MAG: pyrroloquinoline quinone-dependent dehydrogenase [Geminicoccaceae bacterium]
MSGCQYVPNWVWSSESARPAAGKAGDLAWTTYGGDQGQKRFVDNDQINVGNVADLKLKWIHQTSVVGSYQATPIVDDGVMYVTAPYNHVFAIDAATGEELWHYQHKLGVTTLCCGPNNRGVVLRGELVYMATLDAKLVALDKQSGDLVWETVIADPELGYPETHAPAVFEDKIIVGISGAEFGIRGFIDAYDADTGEQLWRWHTIPAPDEVQPDGTRGWAGVFAEKADGINSLRRNVAEEKTALASGAFDDAWKIGGGSVWMTPSIDDERGWVIATTGNPSPDLDASVRPGDNRWTNSLVAVDARSGEMIWGYQYVPHDAWDFDAASPPILAEVEDENGKLVDGVVHAGKTGWVYVHDLETGRLIRRSKPLVRHENLFGRPTPEDGTRMLPGANGGVGWSPGAFNPKTRMAYYAAIDQPMSFVSQRTDWQAGRLYLSGAFVALPEEDQWGNVSAVDVDTGAIVWQTRTDQPLLGGALTTAGRLVFVGEGNGLFKAYDAETGEELWRFQGGAGINAAPMAFEVNGKLHIAVAAGGNFQFDYKRGDALLVFGLD